MSIKGSELTFIRCSNCKSLVPAVATRCRMCGHNLEAKSDGPDFKENLQEKTNINLEEDRRADELFSEASFSQSLNHEKEEDVMPRDNSTQDRQSLGDSLNFAKEEKKDLQHKINSFDELESLNTRNSFKRESLNFEPKTNRGESFQKEVKQEDEKKFNFSPGFQNLNAKSEVVGEKKKRKRRKKKRNIESHSESEAVYKDVSDDEDVNSTEEVSVFGNVENERQFREAEKEDKFEKVEIKTSKMPSEHKNEAKLLGWLVSFSRSGKEEVREIREGRYFISGERLKNSDMVISHESISTPQSLISAKVGEVRVQDLMSIRGTFIRKDGSREFSKVSDPIVLEHGDSIKFGEYESLVCLLPRKE